MGKFFCDTHAHLSDEAYDEDRDTVIEQALEDLDFIVDVATNPSTWSRSKQISEKYDKVYSTLGLHPHDADTLGSEELSRALDENCSPRIVALGEIGLDYHYDYSPRKKQCQAFELQLDFAIEKKLPVIIHIREAWKDALKILRARDLRDSAVVHCFTGSKSNAEALLDLGIFISFTGIIAFPRSRDLRSILRELPEERIFFETDSPYLAPPPYRGKRNHPLYVKEVVKTASQEKGRDVEAFARETSERAKKFFRIEGGSAC